MSGLRYANKDLFGHPARLTCPACAREFWIQAGYLASEPIHCAHCAVNLELTRDQRLRLWTDYLRELGLSKRADDVPDQHRHRQQPMRR